jgi:hypothetical protein
MRLPTRCQNPKNRQCSVLLLGSVLVCTGSDCWAQQAPVPVLTPYHSSGIYEVGEKAGWTVTLPEGAAAPSGKYAYTVRLCLDVVNFAPRIKAPTIVGLGFLDTIASPVGIWIAYNQLPAAKEAFAMPQAAHINQAPPATERAWVLRSEEKLSTHLKGGQIKGMHDVRE